MNKLVTIFLAMVLCHSASAAEVLEDIVEKTFPVNASGTFSLHAIDGTVQIYGTNSPEVKIIAIKKAFSPARLNAIEIQIEKKEHLLKINTIAPPKPRWGWSDRSGTVDYIISLPQEMQIASLDLPNGELIIDGMRGPAIAASLGSGRLITHNCFCDQKVRVDEGGLDLSFDWVEERPIAIDAVINDGNARAALPSEASFKLDAVAEQGRVASDFTDVEKRKRGGVSEIKEDIGVAPQSTLTLRAGDGNIQISELIW